MSYFTKFDAEWCEKHQMTAADLEILQTAIAALDEVTGSIPLSDRMSAILASAAKELDDAREVVQDHLNAQGEVEDSPDDGEEKPE